MLEERLESQRGQKAKELIDGQKDKQHVVDVSQFEEEVG